MKRRRRTALVAAAALAAACAGGRAERREKAEGGPDQSRAQKEEGMKPRPDAPRVPATPEGLLGAEAVRDLQRALVDRKLLGAHREGELDAPTSAAVRKFQEERGLAATGMPDRETLRALGVSAEQAYGTEKDGG
jgi:peptidoglycan hydrolase-like protein with peptidoglycan-binding domain